MLGESHSKFALYKFSVDFHSRESILKYLEEFGIEGGEQDGFRKKYSCCYHICVLTTINDIYLHRPTRLYATFIDYEKAFDLLWLD